MKTLVYGRFIRAGISFCAETPDKKAHLDFSVVCYPNIPSIVWLCPCMANIVLPSFQGFNWEPGISIVTNGTAGVSVVVGKNPKEAFEKAKNPEAEVTSGGIRVFVAIQGQQVVIGVGRAAK